MKMSRLLRVAQKKVVFLLFTAKNTDVVKSYNIWTRSDIYAFAYKKHRRAC